MNPRTSYVLVGLFVLGLGTAAIGAILWLGSSGAGRHYNTYVVRTTESVAGLSRDGVVKYRGVDVGRIRDIRLDPDNPEWVRLTLEIEEGTPIKTDTVATLQVRGLTGLAYVNLTGGSRDAAPLPARDQEPYTEIPSRPSVWGRLDRNIGSLLDNLVDASSKLRDWLSEDNRQLLIRTLAHLEKVVGAVASRTDRIQSAVDAAATTLDNTRRASEELPALFTQLNASARSLERMADELARTGSSLRKAVEARNRDLARFSTTTLPEASAMVSELREAATNLRRLSERLQRNPAVLLRGSPPPPPGPGEMR
ncbi:MAG: MCE family protein [Gammaproteobacteria bacterium]|nr:MAG: MCE family protein [Gammaproteobacteria bacterium]